MNLVIDATDDTWTCNQWTDQGMWVPEDYARGTWALFHRMHRCGAINPLTGNDRWDACRRCGSYRYRQEDQPRFRTPPSGTCSAVTVPGSPAGDLGKGLGK